MRDYIPRIREAGGDLVILGNGTAGHARWFVEETGIEAPLYTDPSLKAYDVVGARRGLFSSSNPGTFLAALRARRKGFRQTKTKGTATQQGGVFVITPAGDMPYRYVSSYAGDHPDPEQAIAALEQATARA